MNKLRKGGWRLLPLLAALAAGCDLPGRPRCDERPVPADQVMDFRTLYGRTVPAAMGPMASSVRRRLSTTRFSSPSFPMRSCCTL